MSARALPPAEVTAKPRIYATTQLVSACVPTPVAYMGDSLLPRLADDDPRDFIRDPDYTPTTNIEDIYRRWDELVPPALLPTLCYWVTELLDTLQPRACLLQRRAVPYVAHCTGRRIGAGAADRLHHPAQGDAHSSSEESGDDGIPADGVGRRSAALPRTAGATSQEAVEV
jgi:hypothetical protein